MFKTAMREWLVHGDEADRTLAREWLDAFADDGHSDEPEAVRRYLRKHGVRC